MTDLHAALDDYLHTRRALGTQLGPSAASLAVRGTVNISSDDPS